MNFLSLLIPLLQVTVIWSATLPEGRVAYDNFKVLSVVPRTEAQLETVRKLGRSFRSIDFWEAPLRVGNRVQFAVSNNDYPALQFVFQRAGIEVRDAIPNLQEYLDQREREILERKAKHARATFDLENFHTYDEIVDFISGLANTSSLATLSTIGTTNQARGIVMLTLSSGSVPGKPAIYLECGMHAREWISPATCLWIINDLVSQYGTDPEMTSLLDAFDWLITPVSNPDGYVYSWNTDRLWRKNRVPTTNPSCVGVDTNRNFDANFGGVGSSNDPCSNTYGGPAAFSEAESRAMRDVLAAHRPRVKACVSIHSNAQMMLSPYGFNSTLPPDYPEMDRVMRITTTAIATRYGTQFEFGNGADILYLTSGTTKDYVYLTEGIIHGYTLELRSSSGGFVPSPEEIFPTATETWDGLKAMAAALM